MRIKSLVVLAFFCCSACADDTTAALSGATRSTHFVTAVDHTKLVNGNTQVTANQNGTASIVVPGEQKWVIRPAAGTADMRYRASGGEAGYYSGQNFDALLYSVTLYEDPTELSNGDTTIADVEFMRKEDDGTTNLLWKAPIQFSANTSTPDIIQMTGNGIVVGLSPDRYASNGYTVTGVRAEEDLAIMEVGTSSSTFFIIMDDLSVGGGFQLAGPIDWADTVVTEISEGLSKTIATTDQIPVVPTDYISATTATNIAKQIIRDAVSQMNVNLQTAEDTRVAVSNLITILKNL